MYSLFDKRVWALVGYGGQHSAIYKNAKYKNQPIYKFIQIFINKRGMFFNLKKF